MTDEKNPVEVDEEIEGTDEPIDADDDEDEDSDIDDEANEPKN